MEMAKKRKLGRPGSTPTGRVPREGRLGGRKGSGRQAGCSRVKSQSRKIGREDRKDNEYCLPLSEIMWPLGGGVLVESVLPGSSVRASFFI